MNTDHPFKIIENENQWFVKYERDNIDFILMKINKTDKNYIDIKPYFQLNKNNKCWYIVYNDTQPLMEYPHNWWRYQVIKRTNLSYLSLFVNKFRINIVINIIKFINVNEISDTIDISKHIGVRGIHMGISPNKSFLYVSYYDGYQASLIFYSLITFKKLEVPNIWVTYLLNGDIKYSENEKETLICTNKSEFYPTIGKWGMPENGYGMYYLRDYTTIDTHIPVSVENIIMGKVGIKANYYTKEDIEYLWQCAENDELESNNELKTVGTVKIIYDDLTDELIVERQRDEEFFSIFPKTWSFDY